MKFFKELLVVLPVMAILLGIGILKAHASYIPIPEQLCGILPCPAGTSGEEMTKNLVGRIIDNVRFIIGAVAILMIIISGIKLVMSGGNEEVFTKQSATLIYAVIGLLFVGLAGELATIFDVSGGGFLKDPNVMIQKGRLFSRTAAIFITFIKYIIGSVAVFFIIRSALRMIFSGDEEEVMTKEKKNLFYGILGLVFILLSNTVITQVFFKIDMNKFPGTGPVQPAIDRLRLLQEVTGATNIIAAIAGPLALLSFVVGGLLYILAGGEEEKMNRAKKILTWSGISLILIYGAFAIVSTFVARQFEGL